MILIVSFFGGGQVFCFYRKVKTKGWWDTPTEGLAVATINDDILTINELLKWMIDQEILDPRNVPLPKQETNYKNYREDANPAFYPTLGKNLRKHYSHGKRNLVLELTVNTVGTILLMKSGRGEIHGLFTGSSSGIISVVGRINK